MAFPIILPYAIKSKLSHDNFYTNYYAIKNSDETLYEVAEFYPRFMAIRSASGRLEPNPKFITEYEVSLNRFINLADALSDLNDPHIKFFQANNTAYIVRHKTEDDCITMPLSSMLSWEEEPLKLEEINSTPVTDKKQKPRKLYIYIAMLSPFLLVFFVLIYLVSLDTEQQSNVQQTIRRRHTAYAITDPNDPSIILNGSFLDYEGFYLTALVRPAFITIYGNYIYFSDGLLNHYIRRVSKDGSALETVKYNAASFLFIHENWLFYTNHYNRDFIYKMDLISHTSEVFFEQAAYEMIAFDGKLFFINGAQNFNIYYISLEEPFVSTRLNESNSSNLRIVNRHIFYRNVETNNINRLTLKGEAIALDIPINTASFDIIGNDMLIVEQQSNILFYYNLDAESLPIAIGDVVAYAKLSYCGDIARVIDFDDTKSLRTINLLEIY